MRKHPAASTAKVLTYELDSLAIMHATCNNITSGLKGWSQFHTTLFPMPLGKKEQWREH